MTDTTSPAGPISEGQAIEALSEHVPLRLEDRALALAFIVSIRSSLPQTFDPDVPDPLLLLISSPGFGQRLARHLREGERGPALALLRMLRDRRGMRSAIAEAGLPTSFLIFDCD